MTAYCLLTTSASQSYTAGFFGTVSVFSSSTDLLAHTFFCCHHFLYSFCRRKRCSSCLRDPLRNGVVLEMHQLAYVPCLALLDHFPFSFFTFCNSIPFSYTHTHPRGWPRGFFISTSSVKSWEVADPRDDSDRDTATHLVKSLTPL